MVLTAKNTRRLNKLLRRSPNLSIKLVNRLLRIATPRLRVFLGALCKQLDSEGGWLFDDGTFKYLIQFVRRTSAPILDKNVIKSMRIAIKSTSRAAQVDVLDVLEPQTPQERLASGYRKQLEQAGRPLDCDTFVRFSSVVDIDLTMFCDSYDLRFRGEGCWPTIGTLRVHRLTVSAAANLKWDVRGGMLWLSFESGAPCSVECSYDMKFFACDVKLPDWIAAVGDHRSSCLCQQPRPPPPPPTAWRAAVCSVHPPAAAQGLVPQLVKWWISTCTDDDPLEIDLSGEEGELETAIDDGEHGPATPRAGADAAPTGAASAPAAAEVAVPRPDAKLVRQESDKQAAAVKLQACSRGSMARRGLSAKGLMPEQASQGGSAGEGGDTAVAAAPPQPTPAGFRTGKVTLREEKEKGSRKPKPKQTLKADAKKARAQGLPGR